jgi:hypothetical protein
MPFDPSDARSRLAGSTAVAQPPSDYAGAEYVKFYELPPVIEADGARTWYGRGQNFVLEYTELDGALELSRHAQPDEYAVLLPDRAVHAELSANGDSSAVDGDTLVFVPPGESTVRLTGTGRVVRLLTWRAEDLARLAANAPSYRTRHPNVADLEPWPEPLGGFRLRCYDLDVPGLANPPFRIFRCTTFMVNYIRPHQGPRDTTKLSPHHHDDFEQCSLVVAGEYVHHIRWPWTTNLAAWRPDEHERCQSPHMCVIPPPAIHTSQATGAGTNHLIDIFAPPRDDFSRMPGWVLNAEDYPAPAWV